MDVFADELCTKVKCIVSVFINKPESFYREDDEMIINSKTTPEVIVFFNFRFGSFGFLDFGRESTTRSLNVGLYDVIAAFKWIKQEVYSFGGDPNRIAILSFGDFASSMIQYLLSSTEAEQLPLSRLVLVDPRPILKPHSNLILTNRLLENLDCLKGANNELMNTDDQFVCLRMKSTKTIVDATSNFQDFRAQSDTNLLNARSYMDLLKKAWKISTIYMISHKDAPFASDYNKTVKQVVP
ncbi:hypothetical protein M3Y97_00294300 [Aphelenchoides bicaudatus]|nr:hypothetical protein M3Y97_00294300 [Aphelenchoides bicaudatus]